MGRLAEPVIFCLYLLLCLSASLHTCFLSLTHCPIPVVWSIYKTKNYSTPDRLSYIVYVYYFFHIVPGNSTYPPLHYVLTYRRHHVSIWCRVWLCQCQFKWRESSRSCLHKASSSLPKQTTRSTRTRGYVPIWPLIAHCPLTTHRHPQVGHTVTAQLVSNNSIRPNWSCHNRHAV